VRTEPVAQNQEVCGTTVPVTRLQLGHNQGIKNAFVYLEAVASRDKLQPRATLEIKQAGCVYTPSSLVIPTGAPLEIMNDDPILHNVHARTATEPGMQTIFNIAQPMRGQRTHLDAPFRKAGVVALTCEAGHPWMSAYVLVTDHPYVAVTDQDGSFVIENLPAGTYPIRMWHQGVRLERVIPRLQRFEYEPPYELTDTVTVEAGGEAVVEFGVTLRES
jgi:hypothetical protein